MLMYLHVIGVRCTLLGSSMERRAGTSLLKRGAQGVLRRSIEPLLMSVSPFKAFSFLSILLHKIRSEGKTF